MGVNYNGRQHIILSRGYYIVGEELYGCGDIILSK